MPRSKNDKNIISLYALLIGATIMNFLPSIAIQTFGGIIFFVTFITTYMLRAKHDTKTDHYTHCSYIIKTIWIFSLLFTVGLIISIGAANHSAIINIVDAIQAGAIPTEQQMMEAVLQFGKDNLILFLILFLPMVIYLFYRFAKGLNIILKSKPAIALKGWL